MLTLSGCAMFSSPPRQAELVKVGHWEGRISLKVLRDPPELFSASFEINGRPEDGELTFFHPSAPLWPSHVGPHSMPS